MKNHYRHYQRTGQILLDDITRELASRPVRTLAAPEKKHAAVALLLVSEADGVKMLFIERAPHPDDPWSGNLAFPGGRVEPNDATIRAAAERETLEEVALDLEGAECLGRLDDIGGAYLPIIISCFVYLLPQRPTLEPNHEVADVFWVPLEHLTERKRQCQQELFWHGQNRRITGINLLGTEKPLLWGITYRLIIQLLSRIGLLPGNLTEIIDD